MNNRVQRILVVLLMIAALVYTVINYLNHKTELYAMVIIMVFLGWLIFGQIAALIREWNDK